jgi:hypothetical protein
LREADESTTPTTIKHSLWRAAYNIRDEDVLKISRSLGFFVLRERHNHNASTRQRREQRAIGETTRARQLCVILRSRENGPRTELKTEVKGERASGAVWVTVSSCPERLAERSPEPWQEGTPEEATLEPSCAHTAT